MIILVEDDDGLAKIYRSILEINGFETRWFTHGDQVLDCLRRETPSLIVIDLVLPDMNGLQLLHKVREVGYTGPIIAISGELTLEPDEKALFTGTFGKPLSLKELLGAVRSAIPTASGEA